jgi:hypothetical protein
MYNIGLDMKSLLNVAVLRSLHLVSFIDKENMLIVCVLTILETRLLYHIILSNVGYTAGSLLGPVIQIQKTRMPL